MPSWLQLRTKLLVLFDSARIFTKMGLYEELGTLMVPILLQCGSLLLSSQVPNSFAHSAAASKVQ